MIIRAYGDQGEEREDAPDLSACNEGKPIEFLISVPTMRIPEDISQTVNAYLAFRAVILAGDLRFLVYFFFFSFVHSLVCLFFHSVSFFMLMCIHMFRAFFSK